MSHYIPTPLTAASARCPHPLLDRMLEHFRLKNDAALARALDIAPPRISKIRRGHMRVSPDLLLRMHEAAQIPVAELRSLMVGAQHPAPPPQRGPSPAKLRSPRRHRSPRSRLKQRTPPKSTSLSRVA